MSIPQIFDFGFDVLAHNKLGTGSMRITSLYSSEQQFDLMDSTSLAMVKFYAEFSEMAG